MPTNFFIKQLKELKLSLDGALAYLSPYQLGMVIYLNNNIPTDLHGIVKRIRTAMLEKDEGYSALQGKDY